MKQLTQGHTTSEGRAELQTKGSRMLKSLVFNQGFVVERVI